MGDHRRRIELPRSEKAGHLMPGLIHAPPDHPVDRETLEYHFGGEIEIDFLGWNSEHLNATPDPYQSESLMNCRRNAGHLENDVDAKSARRLLHHRIRLLGAHRVVSAHGPGEIEPRVVDVSGDHPRCAGGPAYPHGEKSDRATAGDEHCGAGNVSSQRGVKRVAHRVVNATDVEGDLVVQMPHVRRGHRDVLREAAIAVDADDPCVGAYVRVAGSAEQAPAIDDVTLGGDAVALLHIRHEPPNLRDVARKLVSDDEGRLAAPLRPGIPVVDVDVGSAHPRAAYPDQNFVLTDFRLRTILQLEAGSGGLLHQRFH